MALVVVEVDSVVAAAADSAAAAVDLAGAAASSMSDRKRLAESQSKPCAWNMEKTIPLLA